MERSGRSREVSNKNITQGIEREGKTGNQQLEGLSRLVYNDADAKYPEDLSTYVPGFGDPESIFSSAVQVLGYQKRLKSSDAASFFNQDLEENLQHLMLPLKVKRGISL